MVPGSHDDDVGLAVGGEFGHDLGRVAPFDDDLHLKPALSKRRNGRLRSLLRQLMGVLDQHRRRTVPESA